MPTTQTFDLDEVEDLLFAGEVVRRTKWQHGNIVTVVFPYDSSYWMTKVISTGASGWQLPSKVEATRVTRRTKFVEEWVAE